MSHNANLMEAFKLTKGDSQIDLGGLLEATGQVQVQTYV